MDRHLLEEDEEDAFGEVRDVDPLDGQVDEGEVAVGLDPEMLEADRIVGGQRLAEAGRQLAFEPGAGHVDEPGAGLAGRRLEVAAGPAVEVEHVALGVDDDAGRRVALQERALGQIARVPSFCRSRARTPASGVTSGSGEVGAALGVRAAPARRR